MAPQACYNLSYVILAISLFDTHGQLHPSIAEPIAKETERYIS